MYNVKQFFLILSYKYIAADPCQKNTDMLKQRMSSPGKKTTAAMFFCSFLLLPFYRSSSTTAGRRGSISKTLELWAFKYPQKL